MTTSSSGISVYEGSKVLTKQEEIWNRIHKHIKATLVVCGQNPITAEALALDTTQDIWEDMNSKGIVIKVDRELLNPCDNCEFNNEDLPCRGTCFEKTQYLGKIDMLEAGYGAFKPLIKE